MTKLKFKLPRKAAAATGGNASSTAKSFTDDSSTGTAPAKASARSGSKRNRVKLPKLITSRHLLIETLREWRSNWAGYTKIVGMVLVPSIILAKFFTPTPGSPAATYLSIVAGLMSLAITWAVLRRHATGRLPGIRDSYYMGTASAVRYALVCLALFVFLIPLALGLSLYAIALVAAEINGVYGPEQILVGILAIALATPSIYLIVRYGLALFTVIDHENQRPLAALRDARRLTLGRFWPILGRALMLPVFMAVLILPIALISTFLSSIKAPVVIAEFIQSVFLLVLVPMISIYLIRLYTWLANERTVPPAASELRSAAATTEPVA